MKQCQSPAITAWSLTPATWRASAKAAAKMLGEAWDATKQARETAENLRDSLIRPEWSKPIRFPWESSENAHDDSSAVAD
jgi:hypothetical protein